MIGLITALALAALSASHHLFAAVGESNAVSEVLIENMKFSPAVVKIGRGGRVTFLNRDIFPHNVTSMKAGLLDSGLIPAGGEWQVTLTVPGSVKYHCTFHPVMEGTIDVVAPGG